MSLTVQQQFLVIDSNTIKEPKINDGIKGTREKAKVTHYHSCNLPEDIEKLHNLEVKVCQCLTSLEHLRDKMEKVRDNIHNSPYRNTLNILMYREIGDYFVRVITEGCGCDKLILRRIQNKIEKLSS